MPVLVNLSRQKQTSFCAGLKVIHLNEKSIVGDLTCCKQELQTQTRISCDIWKLKREQRKKGKERIPLTHPIEQIENYE